MSKMTTLNYVVIIKVIPCNKLANTAPVDPLFADVSLLECEHVRKLTFETLSQAKVQIEISDHI